MVKRKDFRRGDVYWVNLDPTIGTEIRKVRPALIISPDDFNTAMSRVIIAPLTSKGQQLACRPELRFKGKRAKILLDQIRSIDKQRISKKMGAINHEIWLPTLLEMLD